MKNYWLALAESKKEKVRLEAVDIEEWSKVLFRHLYGNKKLLTRYGKDKSEDK
jgi:hypothetical protein